MEKHRDTELERMLAELRLPWIEENHECELAEAARKNRTRHDLLRRLFQGEVEARHARAVERCVKGAKLKGVRTLDSFDFTAKP